MKRLPKATYLCWRYPFLKFWNCKKKFFQTSCYYYCIPEGWRKAFGIQMIREINEALYRAGGRKQVKEYSVCDVKEKYGGLRWYDDGAPCEVHKIIEKYDHISYHTCIKCGRPATVRTTGWICPYCDEHIPEHQNYVHFGHKHGMSWYGWEGNMDNVPEEIWDAEEELLNAYYGDKE